MPICSGVEAAPALVALQHVERADVLAEPVGLDDGLGERRRVLEAEVEALAGDRDGCRARRRRRMRKARLATNARASVRPSGQALRLAGDAESRRA
jgi:hypothetical protein